MAALGIVRVMLVPIIMVHGRYGFFMNWLSTQPGEEIEDHESQTATPSRYRPGAPRESRRRRRSEPQSISRSPMRGSTATRFRTRRSRWGRSGPACSCPGKGSPSTSTPSSRSARRIALKGRSSCGVCRRHFDGRSPGPHMQGSALGPRMGEMSAHGPSYRIDRPSTPLHRNQVGLPHPTGRRWDF